MIFSSRVYAFQGHNGYWRFFDGGCSLSGEMRTVVSDTLLIFVA